MPHKFHDNINPVTGLCMNLLFCRLGLTMKVQTMSDLVLDIAKRSVFLTENKL